jgi:protein phosphatase 2C family protein 2/3
VPVFRGDDGDASVCVPTEFEYQVLMDSCLQMDADILAAYEPGDMISGSTGVIVLVKAPQVPGNPPMIFCANVGDSRAVLCRAGRKVDLSFDHKAKRPDERARILAAGGTVVKDRLHGVLAVSRAFGDGEHKMGLGEELWGKEFSADPLSAEPEVTHEALQPNDEFVIVACDGIWDVMTSQQAVNFVRRRLIKHRNVQKAAKELVQKAMAVGSADNVSVVIVCFV